MADDAARAIGAPELAGTFVNPKGMAKKMTASVAGGQIGGVAGGVAGDALASRRTGKAQDTPSFGRVGYLAVSETEVSLVKTKTGPFKMKIGDEVLARVPRAEVTSAELDPGVMLSHLTIAFSNGASWQFDIPRQAKKTALGVARELGPAGG